MANNISQSEELFALQSIYDEDVLIIENESSRGRIMININLPSDFKVCYKENNNPEENSFSVQHLPTLNLLFELPSSYPSETCPAFLISCCWLTLDYLSKVCQELESIWKKGDGEVVLFQWITFLQEDMLQFLDIVNILDISRISRYKFNSKNLSNIFGKKNVSCMPSNLISSQSSSSFSTNNFGDINKINSHQCSKLVSPIISIKPNIVRGTGIYDQRAVLDLTNDLISFIKEFDKFKNREKFENNWFTCLICFASQKGKDFMLFNQCEHMYCRNCLKSYFEIQIRDGNVNSLNCPHEKCVSQADGTQVKELVSPELFYKYDSILLSRTLDGMNDIEYCPRQECQCAVLIESGCAMGSCPACKFTFCILCRMVYHGVAPCNFKNEENQKICKAYLNSQGKERLELEKRYGKKVLKNLAENVLSENWKEEYSKKCPRCDTSIEKTEGCNKMTCFKCGLYFCWLCVAKLQASNPYSHFSDPRSPCYQQLFPPEEFFDNDDDDEWIEPGEFLNQDN